MKKSGGEQGGCRGGEGNEGEETAGRGDSCGSCQQFWGGEGQEVMGN